MQDFTVDVTNRTDVLAFYNTVYFASEGYANDMAWNGNVASNVPGTTSLNFKEDVRRRVNFYRTLVGMSSNITFDDANSAKDQQAALMFSAEGMISHTPPSSWTDYTADANTAAGHSNIAIGYYGPPSIDAYMIDSGANNTEVGHRRWILYSLASVMGTGDVPPNGTLEPSNALWVDTTTGAESAQFEKWPNAGYCPFPLMPARWSVSCPGADFTQSTVTMTQGTATISCNIIYSDNGQHAGGTYIGDDSLVWEPSNLPTTLNGDITYTVTISGILDDNANDNGTITYNVTLFDPNVLGQTITIAGPGNPLTTGSTYTFNSIDQADAYDLQVSTSSTATWDEGAENTPAPQVTPGTTGSYSIIQSAVKRTGASAFQLAFPADQNSNNQYQTYDFSDQSFEITRQILPTASSQLQFYDLCRFVSTTSTLSAQVSTDNGTTWTQVWSRAGTVPASGGSSANWDPAFIANNISLSSYAGQVILVRFVLSGNSQTVFLGTTSSDGFFLDDITVTNATQLTNITDSSLPGNATSFVLNSTTAGAPLQAGNSYDLRLRPEVGLTWYGFSTPIQVTAQNSNVTGYSSWISSQYPSATGGPSGDFSGDGICNGIKYAFGLDPTVQNRLSVLPKPQKSGTSLVVSYSASAPGVTYGAQTSTDLVTWTPITDTGTGNNHIFTVSLQPHTYMRNQIIVAP